jgi:DNA-binding response OmpR family regulator
MKTMDVRLLIADDDKSILALLKQFMDKHGYRADLADSVKDAIQFMNENEYDIIITDKNMPDEGANPEGGMSVLKYAREHRPSAEVIMITGYGTVESAVEAMKLGAFDYISKPIPMNELEEKIARIIEYRKFLNSETTLKLYKTFHSEIINVLKDSHDIPEEDLKGMLKTLGSRIDHVFGLQRDYETIIQLQADALAKIESYIQFIEDAIPRESPYYEVLEKIREESKKRI